MVDEKSDVNEENDSFNEEKFKQILHYIIHRTGSFENVGKTVLFKILYFTDFNFYEIFEQKLTGESYRKIEHGPAPIHFDSTIKELKDSKSVSEMNKPYRGYKQKKYISLIEPDISLISGSELDFINKYLSIYANYNATQISEHSHQDIPYAASEDSQIIDYELVFYREPLFSVREYDED